MTPRIERNHLTTKVAGLEECLHELFSDRERHLKAMDNLTNQLRRRDAAAVKAAHELKAITARLECAEQDKFALEKRACAAGEEHRVERARWFVHKQVRGCCFCCFCCRLDSWPHCSPWSQYRLRQPWSEIHSTGSANPGVRYYLRKEKNKFGKIVRTRTYPGTWNGS